MQEIVLIVGTAWDAAVAVCHSMLSRDGYKETERGKKMNYIDIRFLIGGQHRVIIFTLLLLVGHRSILVNLPVSMHLDVILHLKAANNCNDRQRYRGK